MRRWAAGALGVLVLVSSALGCGSDPEASVDGSGLEASLTISRGGGIAGTLYETTIESDGSGVFDEREAFGPKVDPESFSLSEAELEELAELANSTPFEEIGEATLPACADCFVYEITYGERRLVVDSATLEPGEAGAGAGELIDALSRVGPNPDRG